MIKARKSSDWESWIDLEIRRAQERGAFDDLPGAGRPVDLTADPHAREQELGFKILRDAGYAPEWIEIDKTIRGKLGRTRAELARGYASWQARIGELGDRSDAWAEGERRRVLASWESAVALAERALEVINKDIRELNLKVPSARFQRSTLDVHREIARVRDGSSD